jgi:enoyl-CoA hydratase
MGPTRMVLTKPVIAAVEGHAVAGGLELAVWCDLRVAARDAVFGVFCRRWGVPLIDGGTVRLPRLIGHSHALDLILTGRAVHGDEALRMGLANRLTEPGHALDGAVALANEIAAFPQFCLRQDRASSYEQWGRTLDDALADEFVRGIAVIESEEARHGAARFAAGAGRHGDYERESPAADSSS